MNSTDLVTTTRRTAQLSPNDTSYTSALILDELSNALFDRFAEPLKSLRQGYWKKYQVSALVAGTNFYQFPNRAVAQGLEYVEISHNAGASYTPINILTDTQATEYTNLTAGQPNFYVLEADGIRLIPTPAASGQLLRMTYLLRPPTLIEHGLNTRVVTVDNVTKVLLVTGGDPATFGIGIGTKVDIQHFNGSHEVCVIDARVTASAVAPLTFYTLTLAAGTDLSRVAAGDYLRPAGTACFPALPQELHRALCDYAGAMIMVSKGDFEKAQLLSVKAEAGVKRVISMMQPRVAANPFVWKNTNSYLRRNVRRR